MLSLIIDVGANEGLFSFQQASANPKHLVVAVEPIPELAKSMTLKALENNLTNLVVKEVAIDLKSGWRTLQVSDAFSKGTSSLLEFSKPQELERYWKIRPDSRQHRRIDVRTVTLEELIDEVLSESMNDFRPEIEIDFLKIDVQGKDYDALLSIGKYLRNVKAGMLEAPISTSDSMYLEQDKSIIDYFLMLRELDFSIYQLKPNDPGFKEFNIYFSQANLDVPKLIESLKLGENEIYFGNVNPIIDTLRVIDSYKNSLSWKITHPLRLLRRVFSSERK
jgi:FkbM family methyltransferase